MNLFLVRHGLSVANTQQLVTGDIHDRLCKKGVSDLELSRSWFRSVAGEFSAAYVSQWRRAQDTAAILFPSQKFRVDERLGETKAGTVANWSLTGFLQFSPDFYKDPARCYPDGECHLQLNERVMDWLKNTYEQYAEENVLAVCHSGPIACLVQQALQIPMERFPVLLPMHGSLTIVHYRAGISDLPIGHLKLFSASSTERLASEYAIEKSR